MIKFFKFLLNLIKRPPIKEVHRAEMACYVAPKGTGKSTLQAVLANEYDMDIDKYILSGAEICRLNSIGFESLEMPNTLVFSDTSIVLARPDEEPFMSYILDPYAIQVPNNIDKYTIAPPYSLYLVDEPYKVWGNRESASFPERVEAWFWITRHIDVTMYMFFQDKNGVDKKIRDNFNVYYEVKEMNIKYYFWRCDREGYRKVKKVTWELWKYTKYEDFLEGYEPIHPEDIRHANRVVKDICNWLPPFCFFNRQERFERRQKAYEILEKARNSEIVFKKFKGDPFKLFDTKNFSACQYKHCLDDGKTETVEEYSEWAKNLKYDLKENPPLHPSTLAEYKEYTDNIRLVKPESYTKNARARKVRNQQKKEEEKRAKSLLVDEK